MKSLLLSIFVPIFVVLGTPSLIAAIMYDGSGDDQMPTYLYVEDADAKAMLYKELNDSIADVESNTTPDMVFNLHQDIINTAIFQAIRNPDINPNYMPTDDCNDDSCNYIFAEPIPIEGADINLRIVGAWVDFEEGQLITNIFLEIQLNDGFTYKTNFQTYFNVTDLPDKYLIEFDKIKLGNLPIPEALISTITNAIDKQIDEIDLESQTSNLPIGDFDPENLSYSVMKEEILDQFSNTDETTNESTNSLVREVLSIIFENQLIKFTLVENEFVLNTAVSMFRSEDVTDIPSYLYDLHFKEEVNGETVIGDYNPDAFDATTYLTNKFSEYVFNNALVGEDFVIAEKTFNKLIYSAAEGFSKTRGSQTIPNELGEEEIIEFGLRAIWFELAPGEIYANALFNIGGIDSLLEIKAEEISTSDQELIFEFTEITFGKDEGESDGIDYLSILDLDAFKQVFAGLGDVQFGEFDSTGQLIISAERLTTLMQSGSQEGAITVTAISLVDNGIMLEITPTDPAKALALAEYGEELNSVFTSPELLVSLETVLDTTTPGPEQDVYNSVVIVQNLLSDGDSGTNPSAEQIIDMFNYFESLDSATQEEFLLTFEGLIDPVILAQFKAEYEGIQLN